MSKKRILKRVREITPENLTKAHDWLDDLELDIENQAAPAWVNILKGYVRGLWAAEAITIVELDEFDEVLVECGY